MTFAEYFRGPDRSKSQLLKRFGSLLEPWSDTELEDRAKEAQRLTRRFFGRTMRLFAPLYLSNECINNCHYCGFSRDNSIFRVTLSVAEVEREARHLAALGFRSVLLVSGEHPKFVANDYLRSVIQRLIHFIPSVSLEIAPLETVDYEPLVAAGAEGLVVYQETYDRELYRELHTAGPKKNFDWRLECPERAYAAGFRRIGVGALLGLGSWQTEALALAEHLEYLLKKCWRAQLTVSLPRVRAAAGGFQPRCTLADREFVQMLCALRITFPQVGIVLSTREAPPLRDALMTLGVTLMSAGSRTEPGGYTGQGVESLHLTIKGRPAPSAGASGHAEAQFATEDDRSPAEIARRLRAKGLEPIWKDWESSILTA
ncbi:MAG: 2-iminoacetate synthase ThiH [Chthoniobacterales bacterium]